MKATTTERKIKKAIKNLKFWREQLNYYRESYVEFYRDPILNRYKGKDFYPFENPYDKRMAEIKESIEEAKEKIAKFERITR